MALGRQLRQRAFLLIPLAVLAFGLLLRLADPQPLQELRLRAFDLYQRLEPRAAAGLPVRIVAIDEASLERLGRWPWPRSLLARLVQRLDEAGAKAIVFNLVFAEPESPADPSALLDLLPAGRQAELRQALVEARHAAGDARFAAALAQAPSVVGFALTAEPNARPAPLLRSGISFIGESPLPYLPHFAGAVPSLPRLETAAQGNGALTLRVDSDGVVRRLPLLFALGDGVYPALIVEALRVAQGGRGVLVKTSGREAAAASGEETGVQALRIGRQVVETSPHGDLWLYDRKPDPAMRIPAWSLLATEPAADERLSGAIVLVGATAAGMGDHLTTPLSPSLPGIVLQAQAIEQIWAGSFLSRPAWTDGAEILAVVGVGLLILAPFAWQRDGALVAALLGLLAVVAGLAFAWWAFSHWRLLFDPVTPALVGLVVFASAGIARLAYSERHRREVRLAFGQYVAPAVVARIAEDPRATRLEGETRDLTILFCDIRGFTALAEHLPPEQLARLINRFLTRMSKSVLEHQGTIDKYIGDCLMAFWNAPLTVPHHQREACRTVLDMRRRLAKLNATLRSENSGEAAPQFAVGIGLNSGRCSVGNMGSDFRLAYTAMGDAVNLASRLEGMTRLYGLDCLVSGSTRRDAGAFAFLEVDWIRVKGRQQPETVFALLGEGSLAETAHFRALEAAQAAFLAAYRGQDWAAAEAALAALREAAEGFRLHGLLQLYGERLAALRERPPGPEWDGVFVATSK